MTDTGQLLQILGSIDQVNAKDPNTVSDGNAMRPAELVYGERMSATLAQFCEAAGDHLRIAVRAQHIERWMHPRASYPAGRVGYLKWRSDLKDHHARRTGELMQTAGFGQSDIDRVATLIGKKGIKRDPEVQVLEDVACLVFLEHYAGEFIAKHEDDKVADILRKTARKMSAEGAAAAAKLHLPERLGRLFAKTLAEAADG